MSRTILLVLKNTGYLFNGRGEHRHFQVLLNVLYRENHSRRGRC